MDLFVAAHEWRGAGKAKIIKLATVLPHAKRIQKIYKTRHTLLEFFSLQHYFTRH